MVSEISLTFTAYHSPLTTILIMSEIEFQTGVIRPVECFQQGWELIKDQYWLFFAVTFVGLLLGSFTFYILLGAMYCGIYKAMLRKMNGERATFEDLFKGFNYFAQGLIATLVFVVPAIFCMLVTYASMFAMMFSSIDSRGQIDPNAILPLYGVIFGEGIVMAIILGCIHAFITFAFPLIVERDMKGWDAVKLSAKAVWANLSGVIGLILGEFVIGFAGYLVCGVGLYFVLPLMFAGVLVAYRKVFPFLNNQSFNPPPPDAFRGAGSYN